MIESGQTLEQSWFWGATGWYQLSAHTGTYRVPVHRETAWPIWNSKACVQNPRVIWLKFGGCFFPAGQTCSSLPHLPAFLSVHKHPRASIPGPPSHPLSCILLLLASPSGTRSREKFHQAPLLIPPPKFFMDLWNWKAGKALRELIQLPPLTDEATWAPAAVCLPRATQPVGSRAEMRTQGS